MTTCLYKQPLGYPTKYFYKLIPPQPSIEDTERVLLTSLSVSSLKYQIEIVTQVPMFTRYIWHGYSEKDIATLEAFLPEEWVLVELEIPEDLRYPYDDEECYD